MSNSLVAFYLAALTSRIILPAEKKRFFSRLKKAKLTREENPRSHTCVTILPFDPKTKKILVVHHKKAKSWLYPGGHSELNELPSETAVREAKEEISLRTTTNNLLGPFSAQVLTIVDPAQICREHYDIFYAVPVSPTEIVVDMREFLGHEWLTVDEAREKIVLAYYRQALENFITFMKW